MLERENSIHSYERKFNNSMAYVDGRWVWINGFQNSCMFDDDEECEVHNLSWVGTSLFTQDQIVGDSEPEYKTLPSGWYLNKDSPHIHILVCHPITLTYKIGLSTQENITLYRPNAGGTLTKIQLGPEHNINKWDKLGVGNYPSYTGDLRVLSEFYWTWENKVYYLDKNVGWLMPGTKQVVMFYDIPQTILDKINADTNQESLPLEPEATQSE